MDIGCYRGLRHRRALPVRGQRTTQTLARAKVRDVPPSRRRRPGRNNTVNLWLKQAEKRRSFARREEERPNGIVHIAASFNNTMISITDLEGNLIAQSSAARVVFVVRAKGRRSRHSRRLTKQRRRHTKPVCTSAMRVKGPGGGRESAIRAIANAGIRVMTTRYDADSAQRLPSAKAAQSLV